MSQLGVILQETLHTDRETRTLLGLLTQQMDGVDAGPRRRRSLKERLRFTGMGCCGATWSFRPATLTVRNGEEEEEEEEEGGGGGGGLQSQQQPLEETNSSLNPNVPSLDCVPPAQAGSGMNLAAALAAERQFRGSQGPDSGGQGSTGDNSGGGGVGGGTVPGTPWRVSLMRLLEETEGGDAEVADAEKGGGSVGSDSVCCVCMGRKKGAAFIPCGHTFCRVCSRELWLNRGCCPLCNRSILEILHIF